MNEQGHEEHKRKITGTVSQYPVTPGTFSETFLSLVVPIAEPNSQDPPGFTTNMCPIDFVGACRVLYGFLHQSPIKKGCSPNRVGRKSPLIAPKHLDFQGFLLFLEVRIPARYADAKTTPA
jgi:hypothetical protein